MHAFMCNIPITMEFMINTFQYVYVNIPGYIYIYIYMYREIHY